MTRLSGLVVSVGYGSYLARTLPAWVSSVDNILVVTSPEDVYSQGVCRGLGVRFHATSVFTENGAKFNKGAGMAEAYDLLAPDDWMLFFDADVMPPPGWRASLGGIEPGNLYGASRFDPSGNDLKDPDIAGFFHLAHVSDPNMQVKPIVDTHWYHAGNYDSTFQDRWKPKQRIRLPIKLTHFGTPGQNWCGVGNGKAVAELHHQRVIKGGWRHEVINERS